VCFAIEFDKSYQKLTTDSKPLVASHQWAAVGILGQNGSGPLVLPPVGHLWHAIWDNC